MSAQKLGFRPQSNLLPGLSTTSSLSLRWRVMLLAMSMVAMVVVLMAVAVYAVVSRALYDDIDNQLHSRAQPADRERVAGRRSRQGDRGHRVLGCERDAGESGPVDLHRQPAGADAAARRPREGGGARRSG